MRIAYEVPAAIIWGIPKRVLRILQRGGLGVSRLLTRSLIVFSCLPLQQLLPRLDGKRESM